MRIKILLPFLFILSFFISKAQNPAYNKTYNDSPFIIGEIDTIYSTALSEKRVLNIYLPDGYKENDTTHYAVIYLLDGSADEDFIHISGLVQYFTFPWINTLPKSILVGIANVDRKRDFTYPTTIPEDKTTYPTTGGSAKFIAFVEKEVQPYIEKKFKTTQSKTLIGESFGGLLATEILFEKPTLFNKYIIVSPSLWWDDGSLLSRQPEILNPDFTQPTSIYIGVEKGSSWTGRTIHYMDIDAKKLADKLISAGNKNLKVYYDYLPNETHATILHPAVFNAFRLFNSAK